MATLRSSKSGRRHLYELPWYVMIGPPGAGKTPAIVNSGLKFPLTDDDGMAAVGGVGGTRNCDWWFTNEAVLIDTAGRYTTQDSHKVVDSSAWEGFLSLLKKNRRRRPINGAIVSISLQDLLMQSEDEEEEPEEEEPLAEEELEEEENLPISFCLSLSLLSCRYSSRVTRFDPSQERLRCPQGPFAFGRSTTWFVGTFPS